MKAALLIILAALGALGVTVGKYGTGVTLIAWILGLISVINPVSFWWVLAFMGTFVIGLVSASTASVLSKL